MAFFKIHPAIGIARVGNSPQSFIGPEMEGAIFRKFMNELQFKDKDGKILKQAARFRIWEYDDRGNPVREINLAHPDVEYIIWSVHLANKKAAFHRFDGQKGFSNSFTGENPPLRNKWTDDWRSFFMREFLIADLGPRKLRIDKSNRGKWGREIPIKLTSAFIPIDDFGSMRADPEGRLIVFGGEGRAEPIIKGKPLNSAFNNDYWIDDIADGPVKAWIKFKGKPRKKIEHPAWIIVGPPDFAPTIPNVVSLYDTLVDMAVRGQKHPNNKSRRPLGLIGPGQGIYDTSKDLRWIKQLHALWWNVKKREKLKPSFTRDIFPILYAGLMSNWVTGMFPDSAGDFPFHDDMNKWKKLSDNGPGPKQLRKDIFKKLRDPWGVLTKGNMPYLAGDNGMGSHLTLTKVQFFMMHQWSKGEFIDDWKKVPLFSKAITPDGLDKAALQNCVGGAFYPGIEVSWLIRINELFSELFRVDHSAHLPGNSSMKIGPGFFTQQMAVPWQTDFLDCHQRWWPGQRPGTVKEVKSKKPVQWDRGLSRNEFAEKGKWEKLGFVVNEIDEYVEKWGPPVRTTTTPAP